MDSNDMTAADRRDVRRPGAGQRSVWAVAGSVLAVALVIAGLAVLGGFVLAVVALSQLGSNK
ncbi:MAG TPA: hypothetical protein VH641_09760 [Streptosporangiaceae bacterium]|jgi:hypothetical protein